jgi:hypothetical protein
MDVDAKVWPAALVCAGVIIVKWAPEDGPAAVFFDPYGLT